MSGARMTAIALLLSAASLHAQEAKKPKESEPRVTNFRRISSEIATSGQPTAAELKALQVAGFKTILNLRTPEEGSLEEKGKVEGLGIRYLNIPITPEGISEEKVKEFSEVVNDPSNKPLLIHCASANRVGALWYIHRMLKDAAGEDQSLAEAHAIGLKSPALEQVVREYVEKHKPEKK